MKLIILTVCLFHLSFINAIGEIPPQHLTDDDSYIAAVVEYNPRGHSMFEMTDNALGDYLGFISNATKENASIIVFPEMTINNNSPVIIPDNVDLTKPGNEELYSKILTQLATAAKTEQIYVVVNLAEKMHCNDTVSKNCSVEYYFFNTNIVFNKSGHIISKYHKINLFGEPGFTPSMNKTLGIFKTDFGVTFGHFICFDILFQQPAVEIVKQNKIVNIIYPTMWFSEMPFHTAVQIQESWAYTHKVNLLAAGANNPQRGSTGSGIYSGRSGRIDAVMYGEATNKMIVARVPKIPFSENDTRRPVNSIVANRSNPKTTPDEMGALRMKDDNLTYYRNALLTKSESLKLTHGDVECTFNVKLKNVTTKREENTMWYRYRAVVFNGVRSYTYTTGGVINCAVIACTGDDLMSCGNRFLNYANVKPAMEITEIEIQAVVPHPTLNKSNLTNIVYHPVTLDTTIMPFNVTTFKYDVIKHSTLKDKLLVTMKTNNNMKDLLTFGILGRNFEDDGKPVSGGKAIVAGFLTIFISILSVLLSK